MASSQNQKMRRIISVMLSFAILIIAAISFYQLTQVASPIQAQTLPILTLNNSNLNVSEGAGTATLSVNVNTAPTEVITVSYSTANGTAVAVSDYVAVSGIITFGVNDTTPKQISITIVDDTAIEGTQSFLLQITNPVSATLGSPSVASINITDNDSGATATPQIFADALEPNNNFNEATETAADAADLCDLTFYPPGDQDYFRWWGKAGITYIVSTSELDAGLDTVLDVYDTNQSLIASNDDIAPGIFESEVQFTANVDGFYYARVTNKSPVDPVNKLYCFEVDSSVQPTSTPPSGFPSGVDNCEFNSTTDTACLIVSGETKSSMNFVPSLGSTQDTDIYKMWIKPGIFYTCETIIPAGSAADTNMIFWDNNGNPFNPWLGNDDKGGLDFGSEVSYFSTYTGWLFIVIGPVNDPPLEEADQHTYDLTCTAEESTPTPTPFPTSSSSGGTGGTGGTIATSTPQPTVAFPTPFPTPTPIDFAQFFTPTPAPPPVVQFQPLPTSTPIGGGSQTATINVTLYYDSNNNFLPELTEGIVNAAVALYDNATGELLSFGNTNETGVARFTAVNTTGAIRVVVPFLNYSQVVVGDSAEILVRVAPQPLPIGIP
ncbi:Calx-beta domain-containing protein [Candidatus Leptofilum sp.]|uniref:Calx-beta domain-containing protein n=1 Tax=Candidatus Leptofilum sp. TaxID=3241576 RepID=UPI003B58DD0B